MTQRTRNRSHTPVLYHRGLYYEVRCGACGSSRPSGQRWHSRICPGPAAITVLQFPKIGIPEHYAYRLSNLN